MHQAAVTFHHDIQMKERARADTAVLSVPASLCGCELLQPQQTERAVHQPQHMARSSALRTVNKHQREMWMFLLWAQIGGERINQPPIGSELCYTAQDDVRQLRFRFYIFRGRVLNSITLSTLEGSLTRQDKEVSYKYWHSHLFITTIMIRNAQSHLKVQWLNFGASSGKEENCKEINAYIFVMYVVMLVLL